MKYPVKVEGTPQDAISDPKSAPTYRTALRLYPIRDAGGYLVAMVEGYVAAGSLVAEMNALYEVATGHAAFTSCRSGESDPIELRMTRIVAASKVVEKMLFPHSKEEQELFAAAAEFLKKEFAS